ncbi:MAG TPA: hypothetical protein DD471_16010 [Planctomycetes bacterium]|nr:hypothetical protein [Planctomycetota bacterium]
MRSLHSQENPKEVVVPRPGGVLFHPVTQGREGPRGGEDGIFRELLAGGELFVRGERFASRQAFPPAPGGFPLLVGDPCSEAPAALGFSDLDEEAVPAFLKWKADRVLVEDEFPLDVFGGEELSVEPDPVALIAAKPKGQVALRRCFDEGDGVGESLIPGTQHLIEIDIAGQCLPGKSSPTHLAGLAFGRFIEVDSFLRGVGAQEAGSSFVIEGANDSPVAQQPE